MQKFKMNPSRLKSMNFFLYLCNVIHLTQEMRKYTVEAE